MAYVRLKDIALKAQVSINTVSRALHDKNDISPVTKKRIRSIADELGYIPDQSAAWLRTKEKRIIGVIITHMDNAFYARILQGINDAVSGLGYTMLALGSHENLEQEKQALTSLGTNRAAGLIIVPSQDLVNTLNYDKIQVPHITIVRKGNLNTQSYFITDSYQSGVLAAEYSKSQGRKFPAYIGFDSMVSCNKDRYAGFKDTLHTHGILLPKEAAVSCRADMESAYLAAKNLIASRPKTDSLFVYNDYMAIGVLRALHDLRIQIPEEITIIGHDDIDEAAMLIPSLTTVRVPKYSLGFESASSLIHLIEGKDNFTKTITYTPELIIRET